MLTAASTTPARRWTTKAEGVYQALRTQILDGSIPPGSQVDHRGLAASLGVSTTPLREAFRRLESEGYIAQVAHHEMRVSDLSLTELEDLYDVRIQLVPYATALAVERATEADLAAVAALAEFPTNAPPQEFLAHHRAFYRATYIPCGNAVLVDILDSLADRSGRYRLHLLRDLLATQAPLVAHKKVAKAFVERRAEALATLLAEDLAETRQQLVERLSNRAAVTGTPVTGAKP